MNMPTHFYLKRRKWTVELVDDPLFDGEGSWCRGLCEPDERTIYLWAGLGPLKMLRTFCHEFLHAVEAETGLELPHWLVYDLEEPLAYIVLCLFNAQPPLSRRQARPLGRRR